MRGEVQLSRSHVFKRIISRLAEVVLIDSDGTDIPCCTPIWSGHVTARVTVATRVVGEGFVRLIQHKSDIRPF